MRHNTTEILNRIAELAERRSCAELDRLIKEYEQALIRTLTENNVERAYEPVDLAGCTKIRNNNHRKTK